MADVDPISIPSLTNSQSNEWAELAKNAKRNGAARVVEVTADDTIDSWDSDPTTSTSLGEHFRMDCSGGNRALTLPPSSTDAGRIITVIRVTAAGNSCSLPTQGGDVVNGTVSLVNQWDKVRLVGVTGGWDVIG